jgi:predicted dehydrogenase
MALEKGHDILLEKPISSRLEELQAIQEAASCYMRKVIVCHVLRYTPFFRTIKSIIDSGSIGKIAAIQASENVRCWHQAHDSGKMLIRPGLSCMADRQKMPKSLILWLA